jgi:hypothetical protein
MKIKGQYLIPKLCYHLVVSTNKRAQVLFSQTYPRTQNIHIFDFEKVLDETHSGEDTTGGRNLRMEIEFQSHPDLQLVDDAGAAIVVAGNPLLLKRGVAPNQCVAFFFHYFTKMMNVSSKGIAVTE